MFLIRAATENDIPELWPLRTRAVRADCTPHYSMEEIAAWSAFSMPSSFHALIDGGGVVLAKSLERIVGFAALNVTNAEVEVVFVDLGYEGLGIGSALLSALERLAALRELDRLHLFASLNAVQFYESAGYAQIAVTQYAHPSGISLRCVHMEKHVSTPGALC